MDPTLYVLFIVLVIFAAFTAYTTGKADGQSQLLQELKRVAKTSPSSTIYDYLSSRLGKYWT
jgi:uncharacterized protein YxeA